MPQFWSPKIAFSKYFEGFHPLSSRNKRKNLRKSDGREKEKISFHNNQLSLIKKPPVVRHRGGTSKENYATIIFQSELKHSHEAQSNGFEERRGWKRESKINSSQAQRIAFSYGVGNFNLLEDREFIKIWIYLKLCLKLLRKGIIKSTLRNSSNIKRERNIYI